MITQALNKLAILYKDSVVFTDSGSLKKVSLSCRHLGLKYNSRDVINLLKELFYLKKRSVLHQALDLYITLMA